MLSKFYHNFYLSYYILKNLTGCISVLPDTLCFAIFFVLPTYVANHSANDNKVRIWPSDIVLKLKLFELRDPSMVVLCNESRNVFDYNTITNIVRTNDHNDNGCI